VERIVGLRPDTLPASTDQAPPSSVSIVNVPHTLLTDTRAAWENVPRSPATVGTSPSPLHSWPNRGAAAIDPPSTSPGRAAAMSPAGSAAGERRSTSATPIAISASGHNRSASAMSDVSASLRSAITTAPPSASRNTPA